MFLFTSQELYWEVSKSFGKVGKTLSIAVCAAVERSPRWHERRVRLEGCMPYMIQNDYDVINKLGNLESAVCSDEPFNCDKLHEACDCIISHRKGYRPNYFKDKAEKLEEIASAFLDNILSMNSSEMVVTMESLQKLIDFSKAMMTLNPSNPSYPERSNQLSKIFSHQGSLKFKNDVVKTVAGLAQDPSNKAKLTLLLVLVSKLSSDLSAMKQKLEPLLAMWLTKMAEKEKDADVEHWKSSAECAVSICESAAMDEKRKRFKVLIAGIVSMSSIAVLQSLGTDYDRRVTHADATAHLRCARQHMIDWASAIDDVGGWEVYKVEFVSKANDKECANMVMKGNMEAMMKLLNANCVRAREDIVGLIGLDCDYNMGWHLGCETIEKLRTKAKQSIYTPEAKKIKGLRDTLKEATL